jgi:hypothetical protein
MYFQNPFSQDYMGNWVLGDRQNVITFKCPANAGRSQMSVGSWAGAPFDLSGNDPAGASKDTLVIKYSLSSASLNVWMDLAVNIAGATAAATTAEEIAAKLNTDKTFATYFLASVNSNRVAIRQTTNASAFKFYIANGRAEVALRFNARAGVAQLPTYFKKDAVGTAGGENLLVYLDPANWAKLGDNVAGDVIKRAETPQGISLGLDPTKVKTDWELLRGRSGIFTFKKQTVDASDRVTAVIEYPAGALAGDLAKKTTYSYTGANKTPDKVAEVPYTLAAEDLVTP